MCRCYSRFFLILLTVFLGACGSDESADPSSNENIEENVSTLEINQDSVTLNQIGQTFQLSAVALNTDGESKSNARITWSSADTSIAEVDSSGLLTARSVGTVSVVALLGGVNDSIVVTITTEGETDTAVASITVSPSAGNLTQVDQTLQLTASALNSTGQAIAFAPSWNSSDNSVATVSASGLVTSKSTGTATITASANGISESITVTVNIQPDTAVASITVTPTAHSFSQAGQTLQLSASAFNSEGQTVESFDLSWSTSDNSVATVSSSGLVTAVANGNATVSASSNSTSSSSSIFVDIPGTPPITNEDGDISGSSFYLSGNNSARLNGPVLGNGSSSDENIHKQLLITKSSSNSELLLKQVYAIRTTSSLIEIVGIVQNTSQQSRCGASIDGMETRKTDGQPTAEQPSSLSFIDGSSGLLPTISSYTTGCLKPNEIAYFSSLSRVSYDEVAEFNFDTLEFGFTPSTSVTIPSVSVLPLSYSVSGSNLSVRLVNQLSNNIEVTRVYVYLLNARGFPLASESIVVDQVLTPGEEISVSEVISFNGTSSTIRAVVNIGNP